MRRRGSLLAPALVSAIAAYACGDDGSTTDASLGGDASGLDGALRDAGADGAAIGDAGATDAGSDRDAEVDAGADPSRCDDDFAGALFCDGFEETGVWTAEVENAADPVMQSDNVYRGAFSQRSAVGGPDAQRRAMSTVTFEPASAVGPIHVRAYVHISGDWESARRMQLIELETTNVGFNLQQSTLGGTAPMQTFISGTGVATAPLDRGAALPADRWTCIQLNVTPATGRAELFVDGVSVVGSDLGTPYGELVTLRIGVESTGELDPNIVVDIDEVVLDDEPVPCD